MLVLGRERKGSKGGVRATAATAEHAKEYAYDCTNAEFAFVRSVVLRNSRPILSNATIALD